MTKNAIPKDGAPQIKGSIILGLLGIAITFLLMMICSILISRAILPEGREELISRTCLFAGSLIAGMASALRTKAKRAAASLISGSVILVMVLMVSILNKRGSVFNVSLLIDLAIILAGTLLGGIISVKRSGRRRRR